MTKLFSVVVDKTLTSVKWTDHLDHPLFGLKNRRILAKLLEQDKYFVRTGIEKRGIPIRVILTSAGQCPLSVALEMLGKETNIHTFRVGDVIGHEPIRILPLDVELSWSSKKLRERIRETYVWGRTNDPNNYGYHMVDTSGDLWVQTGFSGNEPGEHDWYRIYVQKPDGVEEWCVNNSPMLYSELLAFYIGVSLKSVATKAIELATA